MQQRRIRKCLKAGFVFEQISDVNKLESVYEFLAECRDQQGLKINISKDLFMESFLRLPEQYKAFAIFTSDRQMIAATVTLKVTEEIIYNYLPGSLKEFNDYSPMAFLLIELIKIFNENGFNYLDLGISSINGKPQEGLAVFKDRMGAIRSEKLTFSYL